MCARIARKMHRHCRKRVAESGSISGPGCPFPTSTRTYEESLIWIKEQRAQWILRKNMNCGIFEVATGRFLGGVGLMVRNWDMPYLEIGYWLRASVEGKGYMSEAVRLLTNYALEELGAKRVEIRCDELNTRSANVARSWAMYRKRFYTTTCLRLTAACATRSYSRSYAPGIAMKRKETHGTATVLERDMEEALAGAGYRGDSSILSAFLLLTTPKSFKTEIKFITRQEPTVDNPGCSGVVGAPGDLVFTFNRYYNWFSSEFLVDDYTQITKSDAFAGSVLETMWDPGFPQQVIDTLNQQARTNTPQDQQPPCLARDGGKTACG